MTGLRERKRLQMREALSATAITLFLEHGFDAVSVAEVAAATQVSKPTLFKYFPTKEDLVLHRFADHLGEAARVVRAAQDDPLEALRRHFLAGLERRDPVTGLNDTPEVLAFHDLVFATPSLADRLFHYQAQDEEALAEALLETMDELPARLLAAQVVAVQRVLARHNWRLLSEGRTADALYPDAVLTAARAYAHLGG